MKKMKRPVLKGKRIDLIIPTMRHAKSIQKHANHKEIAKWLPTMPHPYRLKDAEFYIKEMVAKGFRKGNELLFAIMHKEDGEVIGTIALHLKEHNNAVIGYWLGRKYWRQGIMSEAFELILRYAFRKLKVYKVSANVFEGNVKSEGLLKKFGFRKEAFLREHTQDGKKRRSESIFAILRKEYDKQN